MSRTTALSTLVALVAFGVARTALAAQESATPEAPADIDANQCVSKAQLLPDDEHKGKTVAYVYNRCELPIDMRICLMTEEKGWKCGMMRNVSPQTSWSLSVSHATGQVFVAARPNGSNQPLNSPAE